MKISNIKENGYEPDLFKRNRKIKMGEIKRHFPGNKKNVKENYDCLKSTKIETDYNASSGSSSSESEYVSVANSRKRKSRLEKENAGILDLPNDMNQQNTVQYSRPRRKCRSRRNTLMYELVGAVLSPPSPLRDSDILNWPETIAYPPPVYNDIITEKHQLDSICSESENLHIEKVDYENKKP